MPNRYANLVGSKKISEDFNNINIGFDSCFLITLACWFPIIRMVYKFVCGRSAAQRSSLALIGWLALILYKS